MITVNGFTQAAIVTAINTALTNGMDTVYFPAGNYVITSQINIDFGTTAPVNRKGLKLLGDNARLQLTNSGYTAFNITCPEAAQNDTRILFENLWFYTDNTNRPSAIAANYACFTTIKDCVFYQVWDAIRFRNGGMLRVDDCFFWGCSTGAYFQNCRDSVVNGCHAYGCAQGIVYQGSFNVGTDGGFIVSNCIVNNSTGSGIKIHGAYTPVINDVVLELNHPNLLVENSQYGTLNNAFLGPSGDSYSIQFSNPGGVDNDYWTISNVSAQSKILFQNLHFSTISNLNVGGVNSSQANSAAVQFDNSFTVSLTGCNIRNLGSNVPYPLYISSSSNDFSINGGLYDGKVKIGQDNENRTGLLTLNGPRFGGGITFGNGPKLNETGDYFIPGPGGLVAQKLNGAKVTPNIVLTQTLAPFTRYDFDVNTVIDQPDYWRMNQGRFEIVGGTYGSFTAASVDVVRVQNATKATIINNIGNVGSLTISTPQPNIIRLENNSGYENQARVSLIEYTRLDY